MIFFCLKYPQIGPRLGAAANPFSARDRCPFHAPPFDKITDSDYAPRLKKE